MVEDFARRSEEFYDLIEQQETAMQGRSPLIQKHMERALLQTLDAYEEVATQLRERFTNILNEELK